MPNRVSAAATDQAETLASLGIALVQQTNQTLEGGNTVANLVPVVAPSGATTVVMTSPNVPVVGSGKFFLQANVGGTAAAGFTTGTFVVQVSVNGGAYQDVATGYLSGAPGEYVQGSTGAFTATGVTRASAAKVNFRVQVTPTAGGATALTIPNPDGTVAHAGATLSYSEAP